MTQDADDLERENEMMMHSIEEGDPEARCHTCGGDGWVDSVVQETGRWGWDEDGPGKCPNCRGSGLLKDCTTF